MSSVVTLEKDLPNNPYEFRASSNGIVENSKMFNQNGIKLTSDWTDYIIHKSNSVSTAQELYPLPFVTKEIGKKINA